MVSIIKVTLSAAATTAALLLMATACGEDEPSEEPRARADSGSKPDAKTDGSGGRDAHVDGDAPSDAPDVLDGGCPDDAWWYAEPGCDGGVQPRCVTSMDACAGPFCDCNGQTIVSGCGFSKVPFQHQFACVSAEGGSDAPSD
jgi:hypothetical protein